MNLRKLTYSYAEITLALTIQSAEAFHFAVTEHQYIKPNVVYITANRLQTVCVKKHFSTPISKNERKLNQLYHSSRPYRPSRTKTSFCTTSTMTNTNVSFAARGVTVIHKLEKHHTPTSLQKFSSVN